MVFWHGWDDPNIAPRNSINYYEDVLATIGDKDETDDFLRFFMVPGMKHCNNGAGFHDFDAFGSLQAWVEEGEVPETIEAYSPQKQMARPIPWKSPSWGAPAHRIETPDRVIVRRIGQRIFSCPSASAPPTPSDSLPSSRRAHVLDRHRAFRIAE